MKEVYKVDWEQKQNKLINGKGVETEMLISTSVTAPIGPVQLPPKMKELEPPALNRGPVQVLMASHVATYIYISLPNVWEIHSKEFLRTIRPSNHIPNYFMECDKKERGGNRWVRQDTATENCQDANGHFFSNSFNEP